MRRFIIISASLILSTMYAFGWYGGNLPTAAYYNEKPFVYRQLIPILSSLLPFDKITSTSIIVWVFCFGLVLVMLYLYEGFWKTSLQNDAIFVIIFASVLIILTPYKKFYDVPRETTLLLIPVFIVLFMDGARKLIYSTLFLILYLFSRLLTFPLGNEAGGESMYIRPTQNLYIHSQELAGTIALVGVMVFLIAMFLGNLRIMDRRISTFSILLFPVLIVLYIVSGYPFEVRVFAEIMPPLFLGAFLR